MFTITFSFRPDLSPKDQSDALLRVRAVRGVAEAQSLNPESKSRTVARMAYVNLDPSADKEAVLEHIQSMPEIAYAEIPAQRELID